MFFNFKCTYTKVRYETNDKVKSMNIMNESTAKKNLLVARATEQSVARLNKGMVSRDKIKINLRT